MATYYTKSCPYCGYKYQIMDMHKHYYGSPFQICAKCRKGFVDKDFIEMGLLSPCEYEPQRIELISILATAIGGLGGFLSLILSPEDSVLFLLVAIIGLCLIAHDIVGYEKRCAQQKEELQQSNARLSNPQYVLALVEIGYDVPKSRKDEALKAIAEPQARNSNTGKSNITEPTAASNLQDTASKAKQLCNHIWRNSLEYAKSTGSPNKLGFLVYIWVALYYSVLDIVKANNLEQETQKQYIATTGQFYNLDLSNKETLHLIIDRYQTTLDELSKLSINPHEKNGMLKVHQLALILANNRKMYDGSVIPSDSQDAAFMLSTDSVIKYAQKLFAPPNVQH